MSTHEHLEHAEHGAHHAQDPFDRRVAVSVAVVAAVLAGIAMLGHRKHNEVLQLTTQASILHTQATDKWGEYQAVNIRDHGYEFSGGILKVVANDDPKLGVGLKPFIDKADKQHGNYEKRLPALKAEAEGLGKKAEAKQTESLHIHHQADRLDYAHLGAEIGIVLCSLALLTKRKGFWFAGLLAVVVALGLVVSAYTISHDHPAAGNDHPH